MKLQFGGRRALHLASLTTVTDEVKQKQVITENLINKILYSRRLLVDHVEALEQCMCFTDVTNISLTSNNRKNVEVFTARNACLLIGTTILEHLITPKVLRLTVLPSLLLTGSFSAMYIVKNIFGFRNKIVERELDQLIRTIDEFGNCIRRNITYFNEIIKMKQQELIESRQIERAWDCITAAKEVTEILYDSTRKLEITYTLPLSFSEYYSPMEELRECEYFKNNVTDYSPKHIKDFHNIFAYVQSQFLLRLALTIVTGPSISELNIEVVKLHRLVRQHVQEEENHFKNLAIEQNKKKQLEVDALNDIKTMQNRKGPVAVLQDSSLKLSACMVAVAGECQALDITLQRLTEVENLHRDNTKQLVEVANNMRSIESALSFCCDDFQRLMLVYNKFLNSKLIESDSIKNTESYINKVNNVDIPESFLRVEISQNLIDVEQKDDFYAYMFDVDHEHARTNDNAEEEQDLEILDLEKRITKSKFRPVLKQLKSRIDPIRKVMLQKEREVLAAKGININKLLGKSKVSHHIRRDNQCKDKMNLSSNDSSENELLTAEENLFVESEDSDASRDFKTESYSKKLKERDNFAEMRNFLAQKQSINLYKLNNGNAQSQMNTSGNEEVLESEC